jgi:hypothetical protein
MIENSVAVGVVVPVFELVVVVVVVVVEPELVVVVVVPPEPLDFFNSPGRDCMPVFSMFQAELGACGMIAVTAKRAAPLQPINL